MLPLILITGLVIVIALTISRTGSSSAILDAIIDRNTESMVASVQELVRVRSVAGEPGPGAPAGTGPRDALITALNIASRLGFSVENLDNYAGYAEFGSGDKYVAALGHIDVVPEGGNWTFPPFGGEIHEGKIFGRGSLDDKGPVIAALFGARAVMESRLPLSRKVRVIFGTDEETGDLDIAYYLSKEKPPAAGFTPDADFPVVFAEKGILWLELEKNFITPAHGTIVRSITGGTAANMVPDTAVAEIQAVHPEKIIANCADYARMTGYLLNAEKHRDCVRVVARGESAHASKPEEGKNAIIHLSGFLANQKLSPCPMTDSIRFVNRFIGCETDGKSFGVALSDEVSGSLTLNVGLIGGQEFRFRITLDIRYPVTIRSDRVIGLVRERARNGGFSVNVLKHQPPLHYPADSELITNLLSVYRESTGDETPPVAIGGGTYARRMPNTVAFGPYRPGSKPPIHRQDECIAIDELVAFAKIYARAIYELAK
jgi:succinyl-diaminopimelate desuccinylase